jgi:hypothetical protein
MEHYYISLQEIRKAVFVTHLETVLLVQEFDDIVESSQETFVLDALEVVNKFNIGGYHPSIDVTTPNHIQVVYCNKIIGFIFRT